MLQKTYSVYADDLTSQHLFIELGFNHMACWCKKEGEQKFSAFEFFQCDDYDASVFGSLISEAKLYSKLLTADVIDTTIIWSTTENLAIPAAFAQDDFLQDNFCLLRGSFEKGTLYQTISGNVAMVTKVDVYLSNIVQKIFPHAAFAGGFKLSKPAIPTEAFIFFYPHTFFLFVYKDEKLQFAQSKLYSSPADVLYFILNVFQQYNIEKDVVLNAGGFINEDSKLFETLYQYTNINFGVVDEQLFASGAFKEYPAHYFFPYINYLS